MGSDRNQVACMYLHLASPTMFQNEMQNSDEQGCCVQMSVTAGQLCNLLSTTNKTHEAQVYCRYTDSEVQICALVQTGHACATSLQ